MVDARQPLTQLRRGVLEYCVLSLLARDRLYGFDIVRKLAEVEELVTSEGTIYPLLSRLRRDGWVETTWVESAEGPPRRYYTITQAGGHALASFVADWNRFRVCVDTMLTGGQAMTTELDHPLVTDYLHRLDAAAAVLPPQQRAELVAEIRAHVAESLAGAPADEAAVRNVLQRLGSPEEIGAAAADDVDRPSAGGSPVPGPRAAPGAGLEIAAVLLIMVGSVLLPVVGWLIGIVLLWMSRWLKTGEKLLCTLLVPGGPGILLLAGLLGAGSAACSTTTVNGTVVDDTCAAQPAWLGVLPWAFGLALLASLVIPVLLLVVARRRAEASVALVPATGMPAPAR